MGQRGPAKTPTKILKLRGTDRADRQVNEPIPPEEAPECPDWLMLEAKRVWDQIVPRLRKMGLATIIDSNALMRYCVALVRWRKAVKFIEENGEAYPLKDKHGKVTYLQQFPQVSIAHKLSLELLRLEQQFGMTPSARSTIDVGTAVKPPIDPVLAKFIRPNRA